MTEYDYTDAYSNVSLEEGNQSSTYREFVSGKPCRTYHRLVNLLHVASLDVWAHPWMNFNPPQPKNQSRLNILQISFLKTLWR